jgi:ribosomal protein L7Ae-like RNA K-turn-binding protein
MFRDMLTTALVDRLTGLLGMARKSSQVVSGGNLVLAALDHPEKLAVVILADDVSAGVADKVVSKARGRDIRCLSFSTKAVLGHLLGRGERSVTALMKGHLAEAFLEEWQKYQQISGEN